MKLSNVALVLLLLSVIFLPVAAANVSVQPRLYFEEETAVPIEIWITLIILGVSIFLLSIITQAKTILGLLAFGFFSAAAFTAPLVGYFSYFVVNATQSSYEFVPYVHLATQPWVMWFLWGLATISFFIMVWGILIYFIDLKEVEESGRWI
jgi:hypothetical protein